METTIYDKKLVTSVSTKPTNSYLYLDGTWCHQTKKIDAISTGVAKWLKQICSNDCEFLEQSKKYSPYFSLRHHKPKEINWASQKINNRLRLTVQQRWAKSKKKPVLFTTQYTLLGPK